MFVTLTRRRWGRLRFTLAALLALALGACDQMPVRQNQVRNETPVRVQDDTVLTGLSSQDIPILYWVNPSLIRARVQVTDVMRPTFGIFGDGDRTRVRVVVSFAALSPVASESSAIRFDPKTTSVFVRSDSPAPVVLKYADGRYVGEIARGRTVADRLPSYYMVHARIDEREYLVARVPVVEPLAIVAPSPGTRQFADVDVPVSFLSTSWPVLWSSADYRFQFRHDDSAVVTERRADGTTRLIGQTSAPGDQRVDPASLSMRPAASPFAAVGNPGTIYVITRYRSTADTIGPSDFLLDEWTSSAGARVDIVWVL